MGASFRRVPSRPVFVASPVNCVYFGLVRSDTEIT